jgi:geranylgeranyl pyrophosphate synthase
MVTTLADAIGSAGMAGGQAIDLAATRSILTLEALADMHARKTGALIRTAVRLGALAADNTSATTLASLDAYARQVGLGFQIADDILDVEGETAAIGKPRGSDAARGKATYVSMLGLAEARRRASEAHAAALAAIADFGDNSAHISALADFAIHRQS